MVSRNATVPLFKAIQMEVPHGHVIQQITDNDDNVSHIILSSEAAAGGPAPVSAAGQYVTSPAGAGPVTVSTTSG